MPGKLAIILAILLSPIALFGQALSGINGDCEIGGQQALTSGLPSTATQQIGTTNVLPGAGVSASFPSCLVTVYATGTVNKANIYSNGSLTPTVLSNSFVANMDGSFTFFVAAGCYDIFMSSGAGPALPYARTLSGVCVGQGTVTIPGGSGTVGSCGTIGALGYYQVTGTTSTCDPRLTSNGSGGLSGVSLTLSGPGAGFLGFTQGAVPSLAVANTSYFYSDTSVPTSFGTVVPSVPGALNQFLAVTSVIDSTHIKTGYTSIPSVQGIGVVVTQHGLVCDGVTNDTTAQLALVTSIGSTLTKFVYPSGQCLLNTITLPSNAILDFTAGGALKPATGQTITILGPILAGRQQIFYNALASQGSISFNGSTKTSTLFPHWWGAAVDDTTNDLPVLQATSEAADTIRNGTNFGGMTIDLGCGNYLIGSGQWEISNANSQHHINVVGCGPISTRLSSTASATAIYLQQEKYVSLAGFTLLQTGSAGSSVGIAMGGDAGTGTMTNGDLINLVTIDGFGICLQTTGGIGTSSEITMINLTLQNCATYGFYNNNLNGLDFNFIQLQLSNDTVGVRMLNAGIYVYGGAGSNNGADFQFVNDGTNVIIGFNSQVTGKFVDFTASAGSNKLTLIGVLISGLSTPNAHTAIAIANGTTTIQDSLVGGQIVFTPGNGGFSSLSIKNSIVIDKNNTYTATATPDFMGPGFRIAGTQGSGFFDVFNVQLADGSFNNTLSVWPSGQGVIMPSPASGNNIASMTNNGQGAALTVTSNTIKPSSYQHHVGAGLIKTITVPVSSAFIPFAGTCIQLIPDAAFTTDATGNISKASTAVIGQVMTMCYDQVATKWNPSY